MKPICVPCRRFYSQEKSGFAFVEGMPKINDTRPGNANPEDWKPSKVWCGDLWKCPDCGHLTISGVSNLPFAEHHQTEDMERAMQILTRLAGTTVQINDC